MRDIRRTGSLTRRGDPVALLDEMFLWRHRGWGTPIAMQGLWYSRTELSEESLRGVHAALAASPLGRRVVTPWMPGRPRWVSDHDALPLSLDPVPVGDMLAWADAQPEVLDPFRGPAWRLSAGAYRGGTLVSLVASHALTDARGLLAIAAAAVAGQERVPGAPPARTHRAPLSDPPYATAIVRVDASRWDEAARARGGTPNSLFVAMTSALHANVAVQPLSVAVSIDTRSPGGDDSYPNSLAMAAVPVHAGDDLATIRAACARAYRNPERGPRWFPVTALQYLPDRLSARLTAGAGELDVLCSNIGDVPDGFGDGWVAGRAVHPGLTPDQRARMRTRIAGYLCRYDGQYHWSLVSAHPAGFTSPAELRAAALGETAKYGLRAQPWE